MLVACIDVLPDFRRSNGDEDDIFVPARDREPRGGASAFERMWKSILIFNAPMARRLKNLRAATSVAPTMTTSVSV